MDWGTVAAHVISCQRYGVEYCEAVALALVQPACLCQGCSGLNVGMSAYEPPPRPLSLVGRVSGMPAFGYGRTQTSFCRSAGV